MKNDCIVLPHKHATTLLRYLEITSAMREREAEKRKSQAHGDATYIAWLDMCQTIEEVIRAMYGEELEVLALDDLRRAGLREQPVIYDGHGYIVCGITENYRDKVPYKSVKLLDKNQNSVIVVKADKVTLKGEDKR